MATNNTVAPQAAPPSQAHGSVSTPTRAASQTLLPMQQLDQSLSRNGSSPEPLPVGRKGIWRSRISPLFSDRRISITGWVVALLSTILTIVSLVPVFEGQDLSKKALDLAEWTALKDYIEHCKTILESDAGTMSPECDRAMTMPLPPPPTIVFRMHVIKSENLPTGPYYVYDRRGNQPPIGSPHFGHLYDTAYEYPIGDYGIKLIPKKQSPLNISSRREETAWGLEARNSVSSERVILYHLAILTIPMGFWLIWQKRHPEDPLGFYVSIPVTIVFVLLSLLQSIYGQQQTA
ncbi:hypothetical protein VTL71DRAFT_5669 [Oculimacula yallundae]|uniref:Uncharacterized protein n=1 Tax=Oculimacula yallundae TaxID=86028 RepID=A0ABR4BZ48_9HELO